MTESTASTGRDRPGVRLADDIADVVRGEISRMQYDLKQAAGNLGVGGILLSSAAVCGIMALGAASTTLLSIAERVVSRRMAAAGLTAGYAAATAVLAVAGLRRLQLARQASGELANDVRQSVGAGADMRP